MRKPSKLLSLFLAFVMLLTSLSVGLTALAAEWNTTVTVNGTNVTEKVNAIAHALWGKDGDNGNYSTISSWNNAIYINTTDDNHTDPNYDYAWNGNRLIDNADGDMYTAVKNAWDIVMNVQGIVGQTSGTNNQINNTIGTILKNAIQTHMGSSFQSGWGNAANNTILYGWFGLGGGFEATNANGNDKSYNVYIELDPGYYAWNQFKDEEGNVNLDEIPNKIITERTFYWKSANKKNGTRTESSYNYVAVAVFDQETDAVFVNIDDIKAFNALFADGDNNYWADFANHDFDKIPNAVQIAILDGAIDTFKAINTKYQEEQWEPTRGGGPMNDPPRTVATNFAATKLIFENYFETNEEELFGEGGYEDSDGGHYYAFLEYLVEKFTNAVKAIEKNYFTGDNINADLSLEDLVELKDDIDVAYNIWKGLPSDLQPIGQSYKDKLDLFYYKNTDTADNITSFVPAWNTANAQAYIDAVEELEYVSGYEDGVEVKEYIIETKSEAAKVKELLDAADAAYGNLLWELPYEEAAEKDGVLDFDTITVIGDGLEYVSPQNGYTIKNGYSVFEYAHKVYRGAYLAYQEYLYRQFIEIASKNLDEYVQDSNNNGKIDPEDQIVIPAITILDIVPVNAKLDRVNAAYAVLDDEFRGRAWVIFYMNVLRELKAALDGSSVEDGAWEKYDISYPYYYNWDEKDKTNKIKDEAKELINALDALLGSDFVLDLLADEEGPKAESLGKYARQMIEQLIFDNANSIFQAIMGMVFPLVQGALKDTYVDAVNAKAYDFQRNGGKAMGTITVYAEILFSDPDMLVNSYPAASKVSSILGYKGISQYTSDPAILRAANTIAAAGTDWDAVDWEHVDFEIDSIAEFCDVMGTILRMIDKLVNMVLFDEPAIATTDCFASKNADIDKHHTKGYEKDLIPMLEALGITGLPTYTEAKNLSKNSKWDELLEKLITAILDSVERMLDEGAASNLLGLLPNLSYILLWDKLTGPVIKGKGEYQGWTNNNGYGMPSDVSGIGDLLAPLTELAGLSLYGLAGVEHINSTFVMDIINGFVEGTGLVLPDINWAMIAGLGDMKYSDKDGITTSRTDGVRKDIDANPDEILIFFINYIAEFLTANEDTVHTLLTDALTNAGADQEIVDLAEQLFVHFMDNVGDPLTLGAVIFEFLRAVEVSDYEWTDPENWEWEQSLVDYTGLKYDEAYADASIKKLSAIAINALNQLVFTEEGETLTDFLATAEIIDGKPVLTGDLINTLFKTIYSLDSDMIRLILSLVETTDKDGNKTNIDLKPATTAATLKAAGYDDVAALIENLEYFSWKVGTGEFAINCPDCNTQIKVAAAADGTVACPNEECTAEEDITYTADDVYELTEKKDIFGEITAEMWKVEDVDSFKTALVTILAPFKNLLGSILAGAGTSTTIAKVLKVVGDNGYTNVVKPLLAIFGAGLIEGTSLMEEADFNAAPEKALENVINMVFDLVDAYGADPVNSIISVIPQLASFIDNNGIQNLFAYIIQPLWNIISAPLDLFMIDNDFVPETDGNRIYGSTVFDVISDILFEDDPDMRGTLTWDNLQDNLFGFINIFLKDIIKFPVLDENGDPVKDEEGNTVYREDKYSIVLPDINWADLGGSGEKLDKGIQPNKASVVVKILRYIWRVVYTNSDAIEALLTEKVGEFWGKLSKYLAIADYTEDDFVYLVLTVINGLDSSDYDSTDIWDGILNAVYEPTTDVVYPVDENGNTYSPEKVDELVQFISGIAMTAAEEFIDGFTFEGLGTTIYNSAIPVLVAKNALPLLEENSDIFKLLGITYGYADLIEALTAAGYSDVVAAIKAQGVEKLAEIDWSAIGDDNLFGISNSEQFCNALVTLLEPFMPLVGFVLNSGAIFVLDIVPLIGSNGYANALLPLLKTLGIDAVDADTYAADAEADPKNILADIINPLFAWVDNMLWISEGADGPAGTLLTLLPNLAKFFDQGGLQQFIGDITYPFSNLINTIMSILTNGKQDDIFALGFDIAMEMLGGETEENTNFLDKILDKIFGSKSAKDINWYNFHQHVFDLVAKYVKIDGANISVDKDGNLVLGISVSGNPMTIVVPKYNLARLAGISNADETKMATDALLVVWQYIWDGILNNDTTMASVKALLANEISDIYNAAVLKTGYKVGDFINAFITSEGNELVAALIQMMDALDNSDYDDSDRFYGADGIFTDMFAAYTELAATDYPGLKDTTFKKTEAGYYYDENDIVAILDTFTSLVNAVTSIIAGCESEEIASTFLFTDDIAGLVAQLIAQLAENNTLRVILPVLGVDLSKDSLTAKLAQYGYKELAAMFEAAETLDDIDWFEASYLFYINDEDGFKANVDLTELAGENSAQFRFTRALTALLSPFSGLLNALLNGDETMLANVLPFSGPMSYGNAIKPLLDAFCCDTISIDEFATQTEENPDYLLFNILNPILSQLDKFIADPASTLYASLPTLAAFINSSGLEYSIVNILYPLTNLINPLFRLALPDGFAENKYTDTLIYDVALSAIGFDFGFVEIHDNLFEIAAMIVNALSDSEMAAVSAKGNLVINITISGNKLPLVIPKYDLDAIAGCGVSDRETKKIADAFVTIFRYFTEILRINADDFILPAIESLIDDADIFAVAKEYISNVIKPKEKDAVLITLIRLVKNLNTSDFFTDERWQEIGKLKDGVADVKYPAPQTLGTITTAINTLAEAVVSAANVFGGIDLSSLTSDMIYSNGGSLISKIASIIFPLSDNFIVTVLLDFIGVDLSWYSIVTNLEEKGYTEIAEAIEAVDFMDEVDFDSLADAWKSTDAKSFAKAITTVLSPFADLIGVLLLPDSTISIADGSFELDGAFGYRNAIKPFLEALGADPVNSDEYAEMAAADSDNILFNIIYPLLAKADAFAADPVRELLLTLPSLVNYLKDGGLQLSIENLLYPIVNPLDPIVRLVTGNIVGENEIEVPDEEFYDILINIFLGDYSDMFSWSTIHEQLYDVAAVVLNKYTSITAKVNKDGSLTINDIIKLDDTGKTFSVTLPNYMKICDKIANCGNPLDLSEYGDGYATGNKTPDEIRANTFVALIETIWDIVSINEYSIKSIIKNFTGDSTYDKIKYYVSGLFENNGPAIVNAVVALINSIDASKYTSKAEWKALLSISFDKTVAEYPKDGYTSNDINFVINTVSELLTNVLNEFANIQLSELTNGYVYKDSYVSAIAKIIVNLGTNGSITDILGMIGVDLSKNAIADKLQAAGFASAANAIRAAESADAIDWNAINWNANTAEGFAKALAAVVSPIDTILAYILTAGDINLGGVLTITGANGYDNAVKYLLEEAFGCTGLKASSAYANVTELVAAALIAVFDRIDSILASDNIAGTLLDAIPQLSAFVARGGVQQFVEDLIYPITNFLNPIVALVYDGELLDFAFELLNVFGVIDFEIDWKNVHNDLIDLINPFLNFTIKGTDITIKLNKNLTWAKLAGCATRPDTLLTILSYIWENVQANKAAIETLLNSLLGENTFAAVSEYVNNFLNNTDKDIVQAVVKLFRGFNASAHKADWSFLFKDYKATNVKYPEGVTSADIDEIVEILTVAIENALDIFLNTSLPTLAGDLIYTDSIVNAVKKVINSLAENDTVKTVFGLLGLDINVNEKTYNVTDKESFSAALDDILTPFKPIIEAFLAKGDITIADVVTITGADGFNNAVKPFLEYALGCTNVTDSSIKGIILAVLDRVEEILADPVAELVDILPMISNFIGKGGVQYFVEELLYPVINIADAIISLVTNENLFDFAFKLLGVDLTWGNLQNEIVPLANSMLTNISINGKSYSFTIPEIDWLKLGGCGKLSGTSIGAVRGDVIMTLLEYIFKALEANKAVLFDLVGGADSTVGQIIANVLEQGAGGMVKILVNILLKMETFDNVEWFFKNIKHVVTTYTPNYGEEDYAQFVQDIDEAIFGLLGSFVNINIGTLLNDMVYKNSIVNTVAKLVYTNLENINLGGISIHQILKAIDLDITTASVADMLSDFSVASKEIGAHGAWAEVNFDAITWNFNDGDKVGFINALSAALRPIQPLIRVILSGEDLIVLGSIEIKGGNGYNTTVIPLLEALGVSPSSLVSPAQYSAAADTDKVLTSVLTPVLDLAETLLNKPILTLCEMLPNIAYFLLNGGAEAIVRNIAGPVFNILEEVAPIYDLNIDLSMLSDLDLDGLVNTLLEKIEINGQPLTIRITDIDLETLAGRGELVTYRSARTYNGVQMNAKKVVADAPAVFVSMLRYIIQNLKANLDAIKDLLAGLGLSGEIADMIDMILGFLTDLDVDMVIEELLGLLFGTGGGGEGNNGGTAPYEVRNLSSIYWTIVALATAFMVLVFLAVFSKKKKVEPKAEAASEAEGE